MNRMLRPKKPRFHRFLQYRHVHVYFVYSLTWNTDIPWDLLCDEFETKGWITPRLHDRAGLTGHQPFVANYQPNLVGQKRVLERSRDIQHDAVVVVPMEPEYPIKDPRQHTISCKLAYTIRIFQSGGATCTFRASISNHNTLDAAAMFESIHYILHLARNVDYVSPERSTEAAHSKHLTDSYLSLPENSAIDPADDRSLYPKNGETCTLHDLLRTASQQPPKWLMWQDRNIWDQKDALDRSDPRQDFQSPFVITVAEVDSTSFEAFRHRPSPNSAREVASILCKLTLDNRFIKRDFLNLTHDYITKVLDYDFVHKRLLNYCLDARVFFAFSKRGALAMTTELDGIPACFVIPSLLNLLELIRTRWHTSCILNMEIDNLIDRIAARPQSTLEKGIDLTVNTELINALFLLRESYTRFLRDPVPYLFDSGSVTEIAKRARAELGLEDLSNTLHRKMEVLDAIRKDLEARERVIRRARYDEEFQRVEAQLKQAQNAGP